MIETPGPATKYKRVLLKISGEALMGSQGYGLHPPTVERIALEVKTVRDLGVEICMVIGEAISSAVCRVLLRGWNGRRQTLWACWPQ